jgi:proteasome accessory factor B
MVPGYEASGESLRRMFERDKEELRLLGIPIERRFTDVWEIEEGYLIDKERYYLPALDLDPDEMAALWVVSGVSVEPGPKEDQAMLKLAMGAGMDPDPASPPWLRARLHLDTPSLSTLVEAVAASRRVKFVYRTAGRRAESSRLVDPYALVHSAGKWYVIGHDHLRGAVRDFNLHRVASRVTFASKNPGPDFAIPEGFTAVRAGPTTDHWAGEEGADVEVALSPNIAWWVMSSLGLESAGSWKDWTLIRLKVADDEGFLSWVIGFGEDAVIRSPARLRKAIVERLSAVATQPVRRAARRTTGNGARSKVRA